MLQINEPIYHQLINNLNIQPYHQLRIYQIYAFLVIMMVIILLVKYYYKYHYIILMIILYEF